MTNYAPSTMAEAAKRAEKKHIPKRGKLGAENKKDKREIEKVLTGFDKRKDRIKKQAQQKMLQKEFKKKAIEEAQAMNMKKIKANEARDKEVEKQQKRLKLISK